MARSRRPSRRRRPKRRKPLPSLPVYGGPFGLAQAERLLWRAGFGPRPGEAEAFAALGVRGAVKALTRPASRELAGPAPSVDGLPLAPTDAWGHDVLWWMDRMIRSQAPLVERMTLVWHDWFATSRDGVDAEWMLRQNELFRAHGLGIFSGLMRRVTADPAMLLWLNGVDNSKWAPNENYAREAQELFALGAGRGYSERDVREIARALTGFRSEWSEGIGAHGFRFDRRQHDGGVKRIYGRRGRFGWKEGIDLVVAHPRHASFMVTKLWGYFVPTPPSADTSRRLQQLYVRSGHRIRPLLEAILLHPALHEGPRMVKPPIVYTAGLLRATNAGITTDRWGWLTGLSGQTPFRPPNVSGWDDTRWLDTSTWRGRWITANEVVGKATLDPGKSPYPETETPAEAVAAARAYWGSPTLSDATVAELTTFAQRCEAAAGTAKWKRKQYPILRQNALRLLVATSPDLHTS